MVDIATIKQGTNILMPVRFKGLDLEDVASIDFVIRQGCANWEFSYPSETAIRREGETDLIDVVWTERDTWQFNKNHDILMDTKVHLKDSWQNPNTTIVKFRLSRTLFEEGDDNG